MTTTPLPQPAFNEEIAIGYGNVETHSYYTAAQMKAYAAASRADLEAENARLHKLLAWIIDECHVYPEGDEAKAFANRLIAAITHPKAGAALKETL